MHVLQNQVSMAEELEIDDHVPCSSHRRKSDVWAFFEKKKGFKSVSCKLCDKVFAYHGGTSNLREHLLRIHPSEFKGQTKQQEQQSSLDPFVARAKCPHSRAKQITDLIANMVACDIRPAAIVEGDGFKALMKFVEPGYKVPSATHIAQIVHQKHELGKRILKEKLKLEANGLAFTTDIWTSCSNDSYISLTAHFITHSWQMVSCILATSPFPRQHTAVNIIEKLKEIMQSYELDFSKVIALVHDQGSNMQLTGEMLEVESGCESLSCAAHKFQLCVEEALSINVITRALGASRKLVGHFRHSPLASNALRKRQESMGTPVLKLQQDCATRWNSQYYMIKSLLECRWPITAVLSDETVTKRQYRYLELFSENWLILEDLVKVLEPFETATVVLSKEANVSLSTVLPIMYGLKKKLVVSEDDSSTMRQLKIKLTEAMAR